MSPAGETASMPFDEAARCLAELGHAHRLQVFHLLIQAGDAGLSVSQIQGALGIPKSTLAHHVSALVSAGAEPRFVNGVALPVDGGSVAWLSANLD